MPESQGTSLTPIGNAAVPQPLMVPFYTQEGYKYLCWAACARMMLEFAHQPSLSLCQIADQVLHNNCCDDLAGCDTDQDPSDVYGKLLFSSSYIASAFDESSLQNWLLEGYPIQTNIRWHLDGSHHTTLIIGWSKDQNQYRVHDPLGAQAWRTYGELLCPDSAAGDWVGTWYNIRKA